MSPDKVETGESTKETNKGKKAEWEVDTINSALETALKTGDEELIKAARASLEGAQDGRMDRQDDFISPEVKTTIKRGGSSLETVVPFAENKDGETFTTFDAAVDKHKGGEAVKEAATKLQEKRTLGTLEADDVDLKTVLDFLAAAKAEEAKEVVLQAVKQAEYKAIANTFEMYVAEGETVKDKENLQYLVNYLSDGLNESEFSKDRLESATVSLSKLIQSARSGKSVGVAGNPLETEHNSAKESIAVHAQAFYEKISEKMSTEDNKRAIDNNNDMEGLMLKLEEWKSEARETKLEAEAKSGEEKLEEISKAQDELKAIVAEQGKALLEVETALAIIEGKYDEQGKALQEAEAALAALEGKNNEPADEKALNNGENVQKLEGQSEKFTLDKIHKFLEDNLDKEDIQELYKKLYSIGYNRDEIVDSNIENYFSDNASIQMESLEAKLISANYTPEEISRAKEKLRVGGIDMGEPNPTPVDGGVETEQNSADPLEAPISQDQQAGELLDGDADVVGEEIRDLEQPDGNAETEQHSVEPLESNMNQDQRVEELLDGETDGVGEEISVLEQLGLTELPDFQEVKDAKEAYLKALITRQKWRGRTSAENTRELRANYLEVFTNFLQRNIGDVAQNELQSLTGQQRAEKIREISHTLSQVLVEEVYNLSNTESELCNEGAGNKIVNFVRRHPFLRMAISGALVVGNAGLTAAALSNPALFWALPVLLTSNVALQSASMEGAFEGIGIGYSKRDIAQKRFAEIKSRIAESRLGQSRLGKIFGVKEKGSIRDIPEDELEKLTSPQINKRFAAIQSHLVRTGESIDKAGAREKELFKQLQIAMAEDIQKSIEGQLKRNEAVSDVIIQELITKPYRETLREFEFGHEKLRRASLRRWAGTLSSPGAIAALISWKYEPKEPTPESNR
ncbi:MAG: hypothetical protein WCP14_00710 [bacterium]